MLVTIKLIILRYVNNNIILKPQFKIVKIIIILN